MNTKVKQEDKDCEDCFKIKCKNCGWEPNGEELPKVLSGSLMNCPDCKKAK